MSCEHEGIIINPPAPTPSGGGGFLFIHVTPDGQGGFSDSPYTGSEIFEAVNNGMLPVLILDVGTDQYSYTYLEGVDDESASFRSNNSEGYYLIDDEGHVTYD